MLTPQHEIGAAIAAAARTINHESTLDETLQAIVKAARNSVPEFRPGRNLDDRQARQHHDPGHHR